MAWQKDYGKSAKLAADEALVQAQRAEEAGDYFNEKKPLIDEFTSEQTNLQTQLNDLVLQSGTDIAEVVQARGGFATVNERLTDTTAQLAEMDKKTNHIVNVLDFGVVGELPNETTGIQEAINYVASLGGGVVQFNNKTYYAQGLLPKENVTLQGTGRSRLKLINTPTNHLFYYNSATTLNHFNIIGMQLHGNDQITYDIIHITEPNPVAPKKTWYMSVIDNCEITNGGIGIFCPVPGSVKITNSYIAYNDIGIKQKQEHFYVTNTVVWGNRVGADIGSANHSTWLNAVIAHNLEVGIQSAESGGWYAFENGFIGCNFIDNGQYCFKGIFQRTRFIGCRFMTTTNGITGLNYANTIVGCYFSQVGTAISTAAAGSETVISSCMFEANTEDIILYGDDHTVSSCKFRFTNKQGIKIKGDTGMGISITNNTFTNLSKEGLSLFPAIACELRLVASVISNNIFRNLGDGNMSHAVFMPAANIFSEEVILTGNVARNMKVAGYQVKANVIRDNNIGTVVTV